MTSVCIAISGYVRSAWGLSSPGKQVGRSSTPCWKRSQVWGRDSEWWPKYMQQRRQCWKWEAQSSITYRPAHDIR